MARSPDVIVDSTALDSTTIDVPLRVGWLLRTCRLNTPGVPLAGNRFAAEIGVGAAAVTKWEKGTEDVDAAGIEGYETVLGMCPGSLRGVIEKVRRTFRYTISTRLAPLSMPRDLAGLSETVWPAMHGEPTGIDWLHFADALSGEGPLLLPDFAAEPVIARLTSELSRSVDAAYLTRYEAMAVLRSSRYHDVVLRTLLAHALADDAQVSIDAVAVTGELPSAELFEDMCHLLLDPRRHVVAGACRALAIMAAVGGISKAEMRDAVPHLVRAYNSICADPASHRLLSTTLHNLPPGVMRAAQRDLDRPLEPLPRPSTAHRDSPQFRAAERLTTRVKAELPAPEDAVLERVVFEALFDPTWTKRDSAITFLRAVPYRALVVREVTALADEHGDADVRGSAVQLAMALGSPAAVTAAERWAASDDQDEQIAGLITLAHWGEPMGAELLDKLLTHDWPVAQRALYAAGMTGSPALPAIAADADRPDEVRAAAQWWLREGSRVVDIPPGVSG